MIIGTLKEVKDNENRVALTPNGAKQLVDAGHTVLVQADAGSNAGFSNEQYTDAGAQLIGSAGEICEKADILVKVKEPIPSEYTLLEKLNGRTLYTYLHLAACDPELTRKLCECNITSVAYETVEDTSSKTGRLPLLKPMSEVAGVLAIQYGAQYLQKKYNGRGVTLGQIEGASPAHTVCIGAGVVGSKSAVTVAGMGAKVTVLDINEARLEELKHQFTEYLGARLTANVEFKLSTPETLSKAAADADLLVGGVLVAGAKAPVVVTEEMVRAMKHGAVIVDVAIDQGGCVWGSRPTSHSEPIYELDGKIFCCITNMPGQAALQSTEALTNATLPYLLKMAASGVMEACNDDEGLKKGINTYAGKLRCRAVAEALNMMDLFEEM